MERAITLGTRGSPLALAQARTVAARLEAAHGWASGAVTIHIVRTSGDKIQDRPLAEVGGKALWTKELDVALLAGDTDFSVHSMKDVESERPGELVIAAMLERADVRDRMIGAASIEALARGARIGTSSPRRKAQLLSRRPDLAVESIRGNVETRLGKIAAGEVDATLLAAAGLDRLAIETGSPLAIDQMLPAPGQAAIGIECRADDEDMRALLSAIDHRPTHRAVAMERAFARALGGSCHSPVAALGQDGGDAVDLRAELLSEDGGDRIADVRTVASEAEAAAFALELLGRAPESIRTLFQSA